MPINPHHISLATKSCNPIYRDSPTDYVSTIHIDILHGDDQERIGEAKVYEVRMDQIANDDEWSLFDIFDDTQAIWAIFTKSSSPMTN